MVHRRPPNPSRAWRSTCCRKTSRRTITRPKVLTKAFEEITGIKVNHQILGEGEVVQAVQTQMQTNRNLYDGYVNDSDLIGTHSRLQSAVNLTDWMAGEGKDVTNPTLDIDDFMGKSFTTGPDGKLWQLPDQQFANLYWFRKDWFDRPDLKDKFKAKYGYELGVPVNWSAYEDIADFFTNDVKEIDGVKIYGHMDYGKRAPDLGWRMTDAWLSMAGEADVGIPNGRPVDEWGIRMEKGSCNPVGASVSRGGGTNSPAAVYAVTKWDEWLRKYAPPGAADLDFYQSLPSLSQGNVAQQIFWYTAFTASMVAPKDKGNNTVDDQGKPLWRMAPSPHGPYWKEGSQRGYQDAGSWTLFNSTPVDRRKAAWLYAQFVVSKTVDVKKSHVGLTFIRDSTVRAQVLHRTGAQAWRSDRVLPLARPRRLDARPASTSPTIRSSPSCSGRTSATSTPAPSRRSRRWTAWPAQMDQVMARMQAVDEAKQRLSRLRPAAEPGERSFEVARARITRPGPSSTTRSRKGETIAYDELIKRWTEHQ